jgi:hypothetical protein
MKDMKCEKICWINIIFILEKPDEERKQNETSVTQQPFNRNSECAINYWWKVCIVFLEAGFCIDSHLSVSFESLNVHYIFR